MTRGRKRTRTGCEAPSTFEKTPAFEVAILDLQKNYLLTGRPKPTMRELLMEGIALLLDREGLSAMPEPLVDVASKVIEMTKKSGV